MLITGKSWASLSFAKEKLCSCINPLLLLRQTTVLVSRSLLFCYQGYSKRTLTSKEKSTFEGQVVICSLGVLVASKKNVLFDPAVSCL